MTDTLGEFKFDLVITLYNEEANVEALVVDIEHEWARDLGGALAQVIVVNNGSTDGTAALLQRLAAARPWLKVVEQHPTRFYGGGLYEGCRHSRAPYVALMPGDLQVPAAALRTVWTALVARSAPRPQRPLFVKGFRQSRYDGFTGVLVSRTFTKLTNFILGLSVRDVNGLPKVFDRKLLDLLPNERMVSFTLDAQLLSVAATHGWTVDEVPVAFLRRKRGASSWSNARLRTYARTVRQLIRLRGLRGAPPVPMTLAHD